jgi:selenocysteine lyase/cysteine desulfurase
VPDNPSFISLYILENALDQLLKIGISTIEAYVLGLSGRVWEGLQQGGWELLTPREPERRAGNVCFTGSKLEAITHSLAEQGILVWGSYGGAGRVRVSTHLYNTEEDVERFLGAMRELVSG